MRQVRLRDPRLYMEGAAIDPVASVSEVTRADLPFEFMLNSLRLLDGFPLQDFMDRTGLPLSAVQAGIEQGVAKGLLQRDAARVWPTTRGIDFLSDLQSMFLSDGSASA